MQLKKKEAKTISLQIHCTSSIYLIQCMLHWFLCLSSYSDSRSAQQIPLAWIWCTWFYFNNQTEWNHWHDHLMFDFHCYSIECAIKLYSVSNGRNVVEFTLILLIFNIEREKTIRNNQIICQQNVHLRTVCEYVHLLAAEL